MALVMSLQEVQDTMGCSRSRVFELLAQGILERAPRYGAHVRIYRDSVENALARPVRSKQRKSPTPSGQLINPDNIPTWRGPV